MFEPGVPPARFYRSKVAGQRPSSNIILNQNMFETSKDLLNIAIATAIVGLAVFSCWAVYYLARILQQVFAVIKDMRSRLHKIDELIKTIKERLEHTTSYLLLISEGVKKLVDVIKDKVDNRQQTADSRKKRKKKKDSKQ